MNNLVKLANRLFFLVLRLHPLAGVSDFYKEMETTYTLVINESSGRGVKTLWQILRELIDLPGVILRFWIFGRKAMAENLSSTDQSSPPTPWGKALISLLLFIWIGPVTLAFSYSPFWSDPVWGPRFWLGENILMAVVLFAGILIGIKRGFPRWSYPYVIGGVLALTYLLLEILKPTPLRNQQLLVLVAVAVVFTAATVRWRPFLLFWAHIRQDWTYLSYGLFFIIMILTFGVDHDEAPQLTVVVMLPSLLTLAGALVHLRSTTRLRRILALVLSLTIALPIWISPVFDGMMRSPSSRAEVFNLLFGGYFILLAILLAPALIGLIKHSTAEKSISP